MKLIAVFCIDEFKKQVKQIFIKNQVPVFSGLDIRGFRLPDKSLTKENWFTDHSDYEHSVVSFSFVSVEQAEKILEDIKHINDSHELERPIHAFQLDVEKFV